MSEPDAPTPRYVVVLGGTGWLGRHVCAAFLRQGHHVVAVARGAPHAHVQSEFVALDLTTAAQRHLRSLVRSADIVVNATDALNATDGWRRNPLALRQANVTTVERLVDTMAEQAPGARLIHIGTVLEYGPIPHGTVVTEDHPPRPADDYAQSRLAGTRMVLAATHRGDVDGVALRLVNLCGPDPSPASFPGKLLRALRRAKDSHTPAEVPIAPAQRDFVDVRDAADAALRASWAPVTGVVVNVGSGVAVEMRTFVDALRRAAALPETALRAQQGHIASFGGDWIRADIRRAERLLGWQPRIGLSQSLTDMWNVAVRSGIEPTNTRS